MGGVTVVQDPNDAQFSSMPQSAVWHVAPHYIVPGHLIAAVLDHLVRVEAPHPVPASPLPLEVEAAARERRRADVIRGLITQGRAVGSDG